MPAATRMKAKRGPDVGQFNQFVDVGDRGTEGDKDAGEDGSNVRRAVARMHLGPPTAAEAVAAHREEDARLARPGRARAPRVVATMAPKAMMPPSTSFRARRTRTPAAQRCQALFHLPAGQHDGTAM